LTEVQGSGGCVLTLVGPANCSQPSFAQGFVEFAWSTNTTECEGPHRFIMLGHPPSEANSVAFSLPSTNGNESGISGYASTYSMVRNSGGYVRLHEADRTGLTTSTGQYHWFVAGFYDLANGGSRSESRVFIRR